MSLNENDRFLHYFANWVFYSTKQKLRKRIFLKNIQSCSGISNKNERSSAANGISEGLSPAWLFKNKLYYVPAALKLKYIFCF